MHPPATYFGPHLLYPGALAAVRVPLGLCPAQGPAGAQEGALQHVQDGKPGSAVTGKHTVKSSGSKD